MSHQCYIDRLTSEDAATRLGAARDLGAIAGMGLAERDERDITDAIPALAEALGDPDPDVRVAVAKALRVAHSDGQDFGDALKAVARGLEDERGDVRKICTLLVREAIIEGWSAATAEAQLWTRLGDPVQSVRWGAVDALAYLCAANERWEDLARLLSPADPEVAQEAAGTLAEFSHRLHYAPVAAHLCALLTHQEQELRLVAAKALGARPGSARNLAAALAVLVAGLELSEVRLQKYALRAMEEALLTFTRPLKARPPGEQALEPLGPAIATLDALLGGADADLRSAALRVTDILVGSLPESDLVRIEGPMRRAKKLLRRKKGGPQAGKVLTRYWARRGEWDALSRVIAKGIKPVKEAVLKTVAFDWLFREVSADPLVRVLFDVLGGADEALQRAARDALRSVSRGDLAEMLERLPLDSEPLHEALARARGIQNRTLIDETSAGLEGEPHERKVEMLCRVLSHEHRAVRSWAAEQIHSLSYVGDIDAAIEALTRALGDPDPSTRCDASRALFRVAWKAPIVTAYPVLTGLWTDPNALVRRASAMALDAAADAKGDIRAVLPAIRDALTSNPDAEVRGHLAAAVGHAARNGAEVTAALDGLVVVLDDPEEGVRFYAARALCLAREQGVPIERALDVLVARLDDTRRVADWAALALKEHAKSDLGARQVRSALEEAGALERHAKILRGIRDPG